MKLSRRIVSLICAVIMMISFMSNNEAAALTAYASGTCGIDMTWTLSNGVLTVSGKGRMFGYGCKEREDVPWHSYKDQITKVIIEEGVTSIGMHMFSYCKNLTEVSLPSTLTLISKRAFQCCDNLRVLEIPYGVTMIDHLAFLANDMFVVYIPSTVDQFGDYLFSSNYNLTIICEPGSAAEEYAKNNKIKYTYDKSIMYNLEEYRKSLIQSEEFILSSNKIDFNISYRTNKSKKTMKLDWDDISGAKKYKIYRYSYTQNDYDLLGCVEKSQCVVKQIKPGSKYFFKIDAVTDDGIINDSIIIKKC